jgi:hypothetical protein
VAYDYPMRVSLRRYGHGGHINMDDLQKLTTAAMTAGAVLVVGWLGWIALGRYRRNWMKQSDGSRLWDLDDLREMRDSGQLTEVEYQALRQKLIRDTMGPPGSGKSKQNQPANPNDKTDR